MELEKRLSSLRKEKGFSQLELAELLDVSRQTVSRWECGTSIPTTENLIKLSRLYGVDIGTLTDDGAELQAAQDCPVALEQPPEVVQTGRGLFHFRPVTVLVWVLSVIVVCETICIPVLFMAARKNQNDGEEDIIPIEELNVDPPGSFTIDGYFDLGHNQNEREEDIIPIEELSQDPEFVLPEEHFELGPW